MFSPIFIIVAFILIDLVFNKLGKKSQETDARPKEGSIFDMLSSDDKDKTIKRPKSVFDMIKDLDNKTRTREGSEQKREQQPLIKSVKQEPRREGTRNLARDEMIYRQEQKIINHSELEESRRLKKDRLIKASRLSDSQVPLAQQDPKRRLDGYDLGTNRDVSIEAARKKDLNENSNNNRTLNIQDDIVKAVIYSEILSKPKSMERK